MVVDGAVRLLAGEFAALFDGLDWTRVQSVRRIPTPTAAGQALSAMRATPDPAPKLPETADALRALLLAAWAERDGVASERDRTTAERDARALQNDRLRHLLLKLKRMQFGAKSERLPDEQLQLGLEDLGQAIAQGEGEAEQRDPALKQARAAKRRARRGALPSHLPRIEVTLEPEDTACPCCRGVMAVIGHDSAERLDVIPAQFRVVVTRRPKLACRACEGVVVQAPAPVRLIEGGLPTEALVAHVLVARYADHLPLYRQAQISAANASRFGGPGKGWTSTAPPWRSGSAMPRQRSRPSWGGCASSCWARRGCSPTRRGCRGSTIGLRPIRLRSSRRHGRRRGRGRTKTGCFWAVARDGRPPASFADITPWDRFAMGGADPPAVVCSHAPGRGQEHNDRLLGAHRGIVQCDGYATCKALADPKRGEAGVTLVCCWSHVRRGFHDLAKTGAAPIAAEALARIAALYRIEAEIRGKDAGHRLEVRRAKSRPLVAGLRVWFEALSAKLPARGPTAVAIRYALNHWDGLERFLDDGRIEPDTSCVERAMRPVALSRNYAQRRIMRSPALRCRVRQEPVGLLARYSAESCT